MNLNKVIFAGNIGRMQSSAMPDGTAVVNMRIASTKRYKDRNGERQEKTTWMTAASFGRQAEVIQQYFQKVIPSISRDHSMSDPGKMIRVTNDSLLKSVFWNSSLLDRINLVSSTGNRKTSLNSRQRRPRKTTVHQWTNSMTISRFSGYL